MASFQHCDGCGIQEKIEDNVRTSIEEVTYKESSGLVRVAELCKICRKQVVDVFPNIDDELNVPEFMREETEDEEWDRIDRSRTPV